MGIADDIKKLIERAEIELAEAVKGIIVLEEAGEDIADRKIEVEALKSRLEGFKAGLKKIQ